MKFNIALLAIFYVYASNAQVIALKGGLAWPSGSYANSASLTSDGFAASGGFGSFYLSYPVYRSIHVCMEAGISTQKVQKDELQQQSQVKNATALVDIQKEYKATYTLIGGYYGFPREKFEFGVKVMVGLISLQTPEYTTTYTYPTNSGKVYNESQSDLAPAVSIGIQAAYKLKKNLQLILSLDNLSSTLKIKRSYTSSNQQYNDINFEVYQLGLGLGYKF